ncbi:MAG: dockerin type I domain-containing protein [Ruminococcus sp.]
MSTATVNGTSYTLSGRKSIKIFDTATGVLDLTVKNGDVPVFGETGTYEIVVYATGYSTDLTFTVDVTVEETATGDVAQDSQITISDATAVLTIYAKQAAGISVDEYTESQKKAADINADDRMDISDATAILTYYARNAAGLNPSWDEIFS